VNLTEVGCRLDLG